MTLEIKILLYYLIRGAFNKLEIIPNYYILPEVKCNYIGCEFLLIS